MFDHHLPATHRHGSTSSARRQPARILLCAMPFGLPYMPSLGLSLLKAELAQRGIGADVRYFGLDFADAIGYRFYQRIAHAAASHLGDWIFHPSLSRPPTDREDELFWREVFPDRSARGLDSNFAAVQRRVADAQQKAREFVERCADEVEWARYRIVGFTSMFQQNIASLALARRIKERHPEVLIVFGGPNCEAEMGAGLMQCFPFVDYVFSGEADLTFPPFAEAILGDAEPPAFDGVIGRDPHDQAVQLPSGWVSPVQNLDQLPYPDFDDFFEQFAGRWPGVRPHVNFETARGCWWGAKQHCTFCGLNGSSMAFRSKSPERALDEISFLYRRYMRPHDVVLMQPSDQILNLKYFQTVLPKLHAAAPGVSTFFETKANLTRQQVQAFADAKIQMVQPGIESLSSRLLKLMRKGCNLLQNLQLLKWCAEAGISPIWNLLHGFPGEAAEDYEQTARLIPRITHLQPPKNMGALELDRFSPYFNEPERFGIRNVRPPLVHRLLYPFDEEHQIATCYTFEFDYAEPVAADGRIQRALEVAAATWIESRDRGALVGFVDDEQVLVWDDRPMAVDTWTAVRGPYRRAILLCDSIQPQRDVARALDADGQAAISRRAYQHFMDEMERRGFLVQENDRVLSLVVLERDEAKIPRVPAELVTVVDELTAAAPEPVSAGTTGFQLTGDRR